MISFEKISLFKNFILKRNFKPLGLTVIVKVEGFCFGPSGVQLGEEIKFIGHNLDKVTSIDMVGASTPMAEFVSQSKSLIVLKVPLLDQEEPVVMKTSLNESFFMTHIKMRSLPLTKNVLLNRYVFLFNLIFEISKQFN